MKKVDGLTFLEYIGQRFLILDGATGTYLHSNGMSPGVCPELFAVENKGILRDIQRKYIEAGSRAVYTFTMGANSLKLADFGLEDQVERLNEELAALSVEAAGNEAFVGGELSTTGSFLKPLGDIEFEQAVDIYKQQIAALVRGGVDFIVIETMIDIQETRAAVLAAKEVCDLPVVACMTFDERGTTLTGTSPEAAAVTLICAGADVVGLNCSTGPAEMLPLVKRMKAVSTVPLIVKPNAGMPRIVDGKTKFDLSCDDFRAFVKPLCEAGANLIGGCCGTDPCFINAIREEIQTLSPLPWQKSLPSALTSMTEMTYFGKDFRVIGERINPTGKPKLKEALRTADDDTVLDMAIEQKDSGAHILDVNVGMPDFDESSAIKRVIEMLSVQAKLPLCIDSSKPGVIEQALRLYPGRALVNSISTKTASMDTLLPVIKKYRPMFILLPIGDEGIPQTAKGRIAEIEKGYERLLREGIGRESIVVDGLVMAVSSDAGAAIETLKVIKWCSDNGFFTVLGISNGSFGLPERTFINAAYLTMAIEKGLTTAIMNPGDKLMMDAYHAAEALVSRDDNFERYLKRFAQVEPPKEDAKTVSDAVITGKKNLMTALIDAELAGGMTPNDIINDMLIPALQQVGDLYERRIYFLPQLIYSAEAAHTAFDYLEKHFSASDARTKKKIVMATVKGDIHDIGKNLVAMLLRNHGYEVIDLGKDVAAGTIIDTAAETDADIIGLSALITTTAQEMAKVIVMAKQRGLRAKIIVGGAVVTEDYARSISADAYAPDAAGAVKKVAQLLE